MLIAGFEDWSVTVAKNGHANWMRRNNNALSSSRCTFDWIFENEQYNHRDAQDAAGVADEIAAGVAGGIGGTTTITGDLDRGLF